MRVSLRAMLLCMIFTAAGSASLSAAPVPKGGGGGAGGGGGGSNGGRPVRTMIINAAFFGGGTMQAQATGQPLHGAGACSSLGPIFITSGMIVGNSAFVTGHFRYGPTLGTWNLVVNMATGTAVMSDTMFGSPRFGAGSVIIVP